MYRASTQKVSYFNLFYFILNFFTLSLFLLVSIDVSIQLTTTHLFRCYRWAAFRQVVDDIDKSVRAILSGDQNVKFLHHIGGAYYVTVNSGYRCVNLRKWFQPLDSAGDIKPTKKGVSLRLDEWSSLCNLVDVINKTFTSLDSAQPCYYGDDHMNQLGWLNCTECHPFYVSLSQPTANSVA